MRRIGFTGRPTPLADAQWRRLHTLLVTERGGELHHGDCVGGDETAHVIAGELGLRRVVHPPTSDRKRAFCAGEEEREPAGYHERNHAIVDETALLINCPAGPEASYPRAGEWATVRYARKLERPIVHIWPNGSATTEGELDTGTMKP